MNEARFTIWILLSVFLTFVFYQSSQRAFPNIAQRYKGFDFLIAMLFGPVLAALFVMLGKLMLMEVF